MRLLKIILALVYSLQFTVYSLYAQQDNRVVELTEQLIKAKADEELFVPLEELSNIYLEDNKYNELVDFINSLRKKNKEIKPHLNYYIALTRYNQMKYLEENQIWDEYFDKGNTYRDEIITNAQDAFLTTKPKDKLRLYSNLLLWQFHKDQEDVFAGDALSDLMNSVLEYSKLVADTKPIKEVADKLQSYGEKGKTKQLYKIYVDKIASADLKDEELKVIAGGFYEEGNIDLAQTVYDTYLARIMSLKSKQKAIPELIETAKKFTYKDEGINDMLYAEKLFEKVEGLGGKKAFDKDLFYLRAYNLEKAKEFIRAKDVYIDFLKDYPKTAYTDEVYYKLGIIFTYALRDIKSGEVYFQELVKREINFSPQVISGLYQLGLLSQWEGDLDGAREYYNKLLELAGEGFSETVVLVRERLNEIDQAKPLEFNLKTFLDASLKEEFSMLDMGKVDLEAHPYKAKRNEQVSITTTAYGVQSGCMQVDLQYLWSGQIGKVTPSSNQLSFNTAYSDPGTKEINLVVVSPTGVVERSLNLLDVN